MIPIDAENRSIEHEPMVRLVWLVAVVGCSGDIDAGGVNPGSTTDARGAIDEPSALVGITLAHNEARAAVQTATPLPSLTWSPALAATAAAWVAKCRDSDAPSGLLDHNDDRSDGHPYYVGENIYASSGQADPQQAVQDWMSEQADYSYTNNSCSGVCGHYTQVVWRDTLEVGCAVGACPGLQFSNTIVCDYGPGGNVNGERPY